MQMNSFNPHHVRLILCLSLLTDKEIKMLSSFQKVTQLVTGRAGL